MSDSDSDDDYYGPALPPGFKPGSSAAVASKPITKAAQHEDVQIGPAIPAELRARLEAQASPEGDQAEAGPSAETQPHEDSESDSDDDVVGPLPPDHPKALLRALESSNPSSSKDKKPKREEWMLVPPKNRIIPGLGLAPRKFLTRTPQDSKKSDSEEDEEALAREADAAIEKKLIDEYDSKMDDIKKDFESKKRRGESLLEIHQKDMKKKKAESKKKVERKPFDRDTDLAINGLSQGDKQKYIEKSKELNTKFSRGARKYL